MAVFTNAVESWPRVEKQAVRHHPDCQCSMCRVEHDADQVFSTITADDVRKIVREEIERARRLR